MPQITFNIPNAYVPRLKAALRKHFPSGINPSDPPNQFPEPTDAEYLAKLKEFVKEFVKREVRDHELRQAVRDAEMGVTDIDVLD